MAAASSILFHLQAPSGSVAAHRRAPLPVSTVIMPFIDSYGGLAQSQEKQSQEKEPETGIVVMSVLFSATCS